MKLFPIITLLSVVCSSAIAKEPAQITKEFCYSLQASMSCDTLKMRVDTEMKVEKKVGGKVRGPDAPHNKACLSGLSEAFEQEDNGLCSNAWEKFGCKGSIEPNLIQQNPRHFQNPILCSY